MPMAVANHALVRQWLWKDLANEAHASLSPGPVQPSRRFPLLDFLVRPQLLTRRAALLVGKAIVPLASRWATACGSPVSPSAADGSMPSQGERSIPMKRVARWAIGMRMRVSVELRRM